MAEHEISYQRREMMYLVMTDMSCLARNGRKMGGIHQNHVQFIHYSKGAHFLAICGWPLRYQLF